MKSSSWRDQFYAEVRMARQVSHPNVCRVYDVGESEGRLFLSMEYVDGEDLASLLRRIGRLPDDKAVEVAQQLCAGLAAAHRSGVLHRDLKPSNVMIDGKGFARITDFGLAVAAADADRKTGPAGTPGYVAPELFEGAAPSVQSDLYALGLVLYELFTGKKAFEASTLAEFHRKQTETNPTPPSSVIKNFDPAVERAILRCLDPDPAQRPHSALSIAAALPGGDPLAAALAAGETPSPEMVAAAGPQGALRPAVAWAYLRGHGRSDHSLHPCFSVRIIGLGSGAHEQIAGSAGGSCAGTGAKAGLSGGRGSSVLGRFGAGIPGLCFPQPFRERLETCIAGASLAVSGSLLVPAEPAVDDARDLGARRSPRVTTADPPYETPECWPSSWTCRANCFSCVPCPRKSRPGGPASGADWNLLFTEAGLDSLDLFLPPPSGHRLMLSTSGPIGRATLPIAPDLPLHVTAAAYHGVPVYFQVIAPWDQPWRITPTSSKIGEEIASVVSLCALVGYGIVGSFFARRNIRRGRGDARGALRLVGFLALLNCTLAVLTYHIVPQADYIGTQFIILGLPLLVALFAWIGYMAVEPYARRTWPKLMVSWQRLLGGRFRDPLVGRDVLLGLFAGSAIEAVFKGADALSGISEVSTVEVSFGQGVLPSIGLSIAAPSLSCFSALLPLAILSITTGLLRRRWLGLAATGLILVVLSLNGANALDYVLSVCFALVFLIVLTRVGLVAAASFSLMYSTLAFSPPLDLTQWYAGRAVIALMIPLALLVYGFYVSLAGQPMFGNALKEE